MRIDFQEYLKRPDVQAIISGRNLVTLLRQARSILEPAFDTLAEDT